MPRRKSNKGKVQKVKKVKEIAVPRKQYDFITNDQIQAEEVKVKNHIQNLQVCLGYIKESFALAEEQNKKQLILDKWLEYVNCQPLPKAYKPPDIRLSLIKLKHFENILKENTLNWLLGIDERSILTQDTCRVDLTYKTLKTKNGALFALDYEQNIEFCLSIINRIDDFLNKNAEMAKCTITTLIDIKKLRLGLQQDIAEFLNRFTYRVLSSEKAYMNYKDPITSEYYFEGKNFRLHISSLQSVPVSFRHLEEPRMEAHFHTIKVTLYIPTSIMQERFTIRALHLDYDHISEKALNSCLENIDLPKIVIPNLLENLDECMAREWSWQVEMQNRIKNEMLEEHRNYEEQLLLYEQEMAATNKRRGSRKDKKKKPPIAPKEIQPVDENLFVNVREAFLLDEQKQYEEVKNALFHPKHLKLESKEINLKQYFILGGIYQLYRVEKTPQFEFNSFNMTYHYNNYKLTIHETIPIPANIKMFARASKRSSKVPEYKFSDSNCPWYVLTFELPEYLCYWSEPLVCQYESIQKPLISRDITKVEQQVIENEEDDAEAEDAPEALKINSIKFLGPYKEGLTDSILNIENPQEEDFFKSSLSKVDLTQIDSKHVFKTRDMEGTLNINDFPLTTLLNNGEIHILAKHLLPRIISSFKFPKEINEDLREVKEKPKAKFQRKKATDVEHEGLHDRIMEYSPLQNNPERLVPLFCLNEKICILQKKRSSQELKANNSELKTFADLVKLINFIKWQYKMKPRLIIDLKPFKSRFPVKNKRFEKEKKTNAWLKTLQPLQIASTLSTAQLFRKYKKSMSSSRSALSIPYSRSTMSTSAKHDSKSATLGSASSHSVLKNKQIYEKSDGENDIKSEEIPTYTYYHWTTEHILKSEFDREKRKIVIQTDRLGYFGMAFKQYEHFPFKYWKLEPNVEDPENEVIFTLETQYVRCVLQITEKGFKGHVTDPTRKFVRNPKMYLVIDESMDDLKALKKMFREKNLNIFADQDAGFYIENGYFSEKHMATELHTYICMAVHSTQMKFKYSHWNRLASRRNIILRLQHYKDLPENNAEVNITPEEANFVEISELCSNEIDDIKLNYGLTWRNIHFFSDLHHCIVSMCPAANEMRCNKPKLIDFIRKLLLEIKPLSFS